MKLRHLILAISLLTTAAGTAVLAQTGTIDPGCNCGPPPRGCTLVSSSCGANPYGGTLTTCNCTCPVPQT